MKKTTKLHAKQLAAKKPLDARKKKSVAKAHSPLARKTPKSAKAPKPVSIASGRRKGGDSDRGLYVRFESPTIKAQVMAATAKTGVSMNAYIVAATLDWVEKGKTLDNPKDAATVERVAAAG